MFYIVLRVSKSLKIAWKFLWLSYTVLMFNLSFQFVVFECLKSVFCFMSKIL